MGAWHEHEQAAVLTSLPADPLPIDVALLPGRFQLAPRWAEVEWGCALVQGRPSFVSHFQRLLATAAFVHQVIGGKCKQIAPL
jgi:hypothetical protein